LAPIATRAKGPHFINAYLHISRGEDIFRLSKQRGISHTGESPAGKLTLGGIPKLKLQTRGSTKQAGRTKMAGSFRTNEGPLIDKAQKDKSTGSNKLKQADHQQINTINQYLRFINSTVDTTFKNHK